MNRPGLDAIPIRLQPLPDESLDSYLETYAELLHVTVADLLRLAGITWAPETKPGHGRKPWLHTLTVDQRDALSTLTGIAPDAVVGMTLARYDGTGLVTLNPTTGALQRPRWWQSLRGSRFCPACLAANGGRWKLSWRLSWTFACTRHQLLLRDTCPSCQRRHLRTRNATFTAGQPCVITAHPTPEPSRTDPPRCHYPLEHSSSIPLCPDGPTLLSQRHVEHTIATILQATNRGGGSEAAQRQQVLDDLHTIARAALGLIRAPIAPPGRVARLADELLDGTDPLVVGAHQHANRVAFGVSVAHLMLSEGPANPDPAIADWLASAFHTRHHSTPGTLLHRWGNATPTLQGAMLKALGPHLQPAYQLRFGTMATAPRPPRTGHGRARTAATPTLFWPGWAVRLSPPGSFTPLRYRDVLSGLFAITGLTDIDYRTARELLRQPPATSPIYAHFTSRLRKAGALDAVLTALSNLAHALDDHGSPIDYARRRRRIQTSQAELDLKTWHATCTAIRYRTSPRLDRLARLHLIETLTGTHPYYQPAPFTLPASDGDDYTTFVFTLPQPLSQCLHQQAQRILRRARLDEPVHWEPPFDWAGDIDWPGPHPDELDHQQLWQLMRAGHNRIAIADRLRSTPDHIRLAATRHPAPLPLVPRPTRAARMRHQHRPDTQHILDYADQGHTPRRIALLTGCKPDTVHQVLAEAGLDWPSCPDVLGSLDPQWLRHEYEHNQRTLQDIAADLGVRGDQLNAHARQHGLTFRRGVTSHRHLLADHGGPDAFSTLVWKAFTGHRAEQRLRRFITIPGNHNIREAAKQLGIRPSTLADQVKHLERALSAPLLNTTQDPIGLTHAGERLTNEVQPILALLEQRQEPTHP